MQDAGVEMDEDGEEDRPETSPEDDEDIYEKLDPIPVNTSKNDKEIAKKKNSKEKLLFSDEEEEEQANTNQNLDKPEVQSDLNADPVTNNATIDQEKKPDNLKPPIKIQKSKKKVRF